MVNDDIPTSPSQQSSTAERGRYQASLVPLRKNAFESNYMVTYLTPKPEVNIRSEADKRSRILRLVKEYDYLTLLDADENIALEKIGKRQWIYISTDDGLQGYVSGLYVRLLFKRDTPISDLSHMSYVNTIKQRLITNLKNFEKGRKAETIQGIVLHTADGSKTNAVSSSLYDGFNKDAVEDGKVVYGSSAHYYVKITGEIEQYVLDEDTAYHAGLLEVNRATIGIEHQDNGYWKTGETYTDELYEASAQLISKLAQQYSIPLQMSDNLKNGIVLHRDLKVKDRGDCPGALRYWRILNRAKTLLSS